MDLYIDFGGTYFRYQFDDQPILSDKSKNIDLHSFLDTILTQNRDITHISISFAGHVSDGIIHKAPNIDIKEFHIKQYIHKKFAIGLSIDNDLNCAAKAEYHHNGAKSMALFYIGTGFGAAFIDDGKLIQGYHNQSGELGHIPFRKTPFRCGCGRDDCIELSVSGSGLKKWCNYYKIDQSYHHLEKLEKLCTPESKEILDHFYDGLSHAFHTALTLFDFSSLVLGGGVGKNRKIQIFLKKELKKTAFGKQDISIELSILENGSLEGTRFYK